MVEGGVGRRFGHSPEPAAPRGRIEIRRPRFWRRVALGGSIGAAEAFAERLWDSPDLTAVLRVMARDLDEASGFERGIARLRWLLDRAFHLLRRNSRRGSRRNIAAHYDLGNRFFATFLDRTMTYSSAVFPNADSGLEQASRHKLDLVCRKLELAPGDEVVEIGSGWGSFALHAAGHYGARVVTTTVSRRQHELASRRVAEAGLADRVQVVRLDFRDLPAALGRRFDKLASIEMIEAVGHRLLPSYVGVVSRLLRPHGLALIQAITMPEQRYDSYRRSVDFIQRHIFPGALLPSLGRILEGMRDASDLQLLDLEDITQHYARTLALWRQRFDGREAEIAALGLPERFRRLWRYYFSYCEAGFAERVIGDVQLLLAKPRYRRPALATETGP